MYNLIRKDVIVLRWYFLFNAAYALVFGVVFKTSLSPLMISMLPPIMMMMFAANMELRNKAMMFVGTLPISRRQIVSAKYVTVFFYYLIGLILMAVVHAANQVVNPDGYMVSQKSEILFLMVLASFSLTMFYAAIYYPIQFWLGVKHSNIISFLSIFLMMSLLGMISNMIERFSEDLISNNGVIFAFPAGSLLLFYGSYRLTIALFSRKDMEG